MLIYRWIKKSKSIYTDDRKGRVDEETVFLANQFESKKMNRMYDCNENALYLLWKFFLFSWKRLGLYWYSRYIHWLISISLININESIKKMHKPSYWSEFMKTHMSIFRNGRSLLKDKTMSHFNIWVCLNYRTDFWH